jgi:hypothetical protein
MTVEISPDKYKLLLEARRNVNGWMKEYNRLKQQLMEELGHAYAGTVDGEKVIYYRPKDQYALGRLEADYPDLVAHFKKMEVSEVLDVDMFRRAHAEILEKYRVRSFVERQQ